LFRRGVTFRSIEYSDEVFRPPIPLKNKRLAPRALRYTTLEKLIKADTVEEH